MSLSDKACPFISGDEAMVIDDREGKEHGIEKRSGRRECEAIKKRGR